jgi:cysteine desulfurase
MNTIYLDYAATTPIDPEVYHAMVPYLRENYGNASSLHRHGREARAALDESREIIAAFLGCRPGEIIFVSGGTEANNHAVQGTMEQWQHKENNHLITSSIEHPSILEPCGDHSKYGYEITFLPVDNFGTVTPESVANAIRPDTVFLSIMHANNEIGTINPISDISVIAHRSGIVVHSDAVQTFGKIPVNVNELGVDLLTVSAHKIYGPKGIGALYIRGGVELEPLLRGGKQERGRRAGTENVALAVGFAKAAEIILNDQASETRRLTELKNYFQKILKAQFPFVIFNGHPTLSLPNIVNISFDSTHRDIDGEVLLYNLDLHGISASSGSACSSGTVQPSHVLKAIGRDEKTTRSSVRFSMGRSTTHANIDYVVQTLRKIIERIDTKKS